jgi:hypothetical protein
MMERGHPVRLSAQREHLFKKEIHRRYDAVRKSIILNPVPLTLSR